MTVAEIKKLLDHGDYLKIARLAGYTNLKSGRRYAYEVLNGRRNANKGAGKRIFEAAQHIAEQNFVAAKSNKQE
jgi:hypothetical protein